MCQFEASWKLNLSILGWSSWLLKNLNFKVKDLYTDFCSLLPQKASHMLRPKGSQSVVLMGWKIQKAPSTLVCSSLSTTVKGKKKIKALTHRVGSKAEGKRKLQVFVCVCIVCACVCGCVHACMHGCVGVTMWLFYAIDVAKSHNL